MKIKEVTDKKIWQNFFEEAGSPIFLQSWEWGEFEKLQGYEILRLGIYDKNKLIGIALVEKMKTRRGNFLFVPYGPLTIQNCFSAFKNYLLKLAREENYSFIRIAPNLEATETNRKIFKALGFKEGPIYMHAERMWVLPLEKSEEELLADMRKTTRYLIRRIDRDGVTIEKRTDKNAVHDFYKIYEETAKREAFIPFSEEFIRNEFDAFNKTGNALFLFGKVRTGAAGPVSSSFPSVLDRRRISPDLRAARSPDASTPTALASALIIFTKTTSFYHQGASIHSKIPVPYLLQWEAIKEAKKRGCKLYNFWGIHEPGRTPKAWTGLTLFKQGFGGKQLDYLATQDFIISPKYYLTYLYEKYLAWRRGV